MSQVLHTIEKQIIKSLQKNPTQKTEELVEKTKLSIDQVRRGMEWLRLKGLADIKDSKKTFVSLGQKGLEASKSGLPERKLLELIKNNPSSFKEIQEKLPPPEFNVAIANAKKMDGFRLKKTKLQTKFH